jgi:hypothetical protein
MSIKHVDKTIDRSDSALFTADYYCEARWPETDFVVYGERTFMVPAGKAGFAHGRFAKVITRGERGQTRPCPKCGAESPEVPGAPTVTKVALPDGTKRVGITDQVMAADLEVQAVDHAWNSPERAEIETEIHERTKIRE